MSAVAPPDDAPQKRQRSCLAVTVGAAIDGCIFGGAIGAIMSSGTAFQAGLTNGGLQVILRSGAASALSVGGFLASYNGGVCTMERMRSRRDVVNPFIVGGVMGVLGAVPGYLRPHPAAPWAYRNPRALVSGGLTSCVAVCRTCMHLSISNRPPPSCPCPEWRSGPCYAPSSGVCLARAARSLPTTLRTRPPSHVWRSRRRRLGRARRL